MKRSEYQASVRYHNTRRHGECSRDQALRRAILGANDEAAELAALLYDGVEHATDYDVLDECGDLLFKVVSALDAAGWAMDDAMRASINKRDRRERYGKDKRAEKRLLKEAFPR